MGLASMRPICTSSSQSPPSVALPVGLAEAAMSAPVNSLRRSRNWLGFVGFAGLFSTGRLKPLLHKLNPPARVEIPHGGEAEFGCRAAAPVGIGRPTGAH